MNTLLLTVNGMSITVIELLVNKLSGVYKGEKAIRSPRYIKLQ